jgi:hypothetical protein
LSLKQHNSKSVELKYIGIHQGNTIAPLPPKLPEIALKHNAESAIIITCEITIIISHVRLSFLTVAEISIKHCILYNNNNNNNNNK